MTLTGQSTAVHFPIIIKTTVYPIIISSVLTEREGFSWEIEKNDHHVKALYYDREHQLKGFVLAGDAVCHKNSLIHQLSTGIYEKV